MGLLQQTRCTTIKTDKRSMALATGIMKVLMVAVAFFVIFGFSAQAEAKEPVQVERLGGENRYQTAVQISRQWWPTAETVVVARGDQFADALAGTPLAYHYDAPILLVKPEAVPEETAAEIERLKARKVIVLGREGAISKQVENQLRAIDGVTDVIRLGGANRFETALAIAHKLPSADKAVLVNGLNFPDALSIAPYAARRKMPIVLTDGTELDQASRQFLHRHSGVYAVGGASVISSEVAAQLKADGLSVSRLNGANRYHTSVLIAERFAQDKSRFMISSGENFADALTGSVLAAKNNMMILLTASGNLPQELTQFKNSYNPTYYLVLGGEQAVSSTVFSALQGLGSPGSFLLFIDPGHGGGDPGAVGNGLREKDLNLDIALRLRNILNSEYKNVQVVLSRDRDQSLELIDRTNMANRLNADYFLSLHINAGGGRGFESYIYNGKVSDKTINAQQIIHDHVAKGLAQKYGVRDRGKKRANFHVLRESKMPAILLENLFIDNPQDAQLLNNPQFRQDLARLIAEGVAKAFNLAKK